MATGVDVRDRGGRTMYRARVHVNGRRVSREFETEEEAVGWRVSARRDLTEGREPDLAPRPEAKVTPLVIAKFGPTVEQLADDLIRDMRKGTTPTKKGTRYKRSSLDGIESALFVHVIPAMGGTLIRDLTTPPISRTGSLSWPTTPRRRRLARY